MALIDPRDEPPWAMQLAVQVEKAAPPAHGAVCEAAAMAVVGLLTDPRAADPEGEWRPWVREWEDRRIRKVARRARGVRWREAQDVPGVTVDHDGARVRAFVPGPVADVPPQLAKLQVAGLDLTREDPKPPPEVPYAALALNPDVTMTTGKSAAQCGHAAQLLLRRAPARDVATWLAAGGRVHLVGEAPWNECVRRATAVVRDGGFTEVPPGTMTAIAWLVGAHR
ncbi:peptidyl-tRNA hydrolase [Thermomonospora umbrina]|uniref:peptidyl-tRNA hydrolase n=1 Tax=Thermomonospora umbrina TaxID=111806 RepID=A0A3D9SUA8_9ACTN|nr:peptidyl-tRNA hydrolase [Thermomonospora umbrina]REE99187.1 peptidyl-tRNA hydrolase [Thermomonospora umbrina]